jgi:hypothetical protein
MECRDFAIIFKARREDIRLAGDGLSVRQNGLGIGAKDVCFLSEKKELVLDVEDIQSSHQVSRISLVHRSPLSISRDVAEE